MKKLFLAAILAIGLQAFDKGDVFKCMGYKMYFFKSKISYNFTKKEMSKFTYDIKFLNERSIIDGSDVIYTYKFTNKNGWNIYKRVDRKNAEVFSMQDKMGEDGFVRAGILSKDRKYIIYSICKKMNEIKELI